jgi:DNA topoisomerase IB
VEHSGSQYASDDFGPAHDAAVVAAKAARLRYVNDHWPGIVRERNGTRFVYRDSSDAAIADRAELARINAIAVPPAWTEVWICPDPDGHIQATGRDARGRKQYRYHARWRSVRDDSVAVLVLRGSNARASRFGPELDLVAGSKRQTSKTVPFRL